MKYYYDDEGNIIDDDYAENDYDFDEDEYAIVEIDVCPRCNGALCNYCLGLE